MLRSVLILSAILASCGPDETVSGQTEETDVWVLDTINDAPVGVEVTIAFPEEGKVVGKAPCNRYFAAQTVPLPWFKLGPIGATKMACPDLDQEHQYFELLTAMTTSEIQGNVLILRSDTGQSLVYKKN